MISTMVLNQNFWWILLIFQANALNAESDRKICGLNNFCDHWCIVCGFSIYLHFVVAPLANYGDFFIWSKWWQRLYLFQTSKWSRTENDDGNSRRFIVGEECPTVGASRLKSIWEFFTLIWEFTAPWEFCVESIYGSFSPLYGRAAVNALQFGHKVHTLCSADNTNTADNTSWYVH